MDKIEQGNGVVSIVLIVSIPDLCNLITSNTQVVVSVQTIRTLGQYYKTGIPLMIKLEQINGTGFKHSGSGISANIKVSRSSIPT